MKQALALIVLALWMPASPASAQDARYCGPPARDEDGDIIRSKALLREFQRIHPCPSTGKTTGACPGWYRDHVLPLVCQGCDSITNLQWLPAEIKTCAGAVCKDRWERRVYCRHEPAPSPQPRNEP